LGASTILIVEDHDESLEYLTTLLRHRDYRVLAAKNAGDGLLAARASVPSLIISDVVMPDCDGYEFTRRLRADTITANIPIILWTASDERRGSAILLAENLGVECVLAKPTEPQELLSAVEKVLGNLVSTKVQVASELLEEHTRFLANELLLKTGKLIDGNHLHHLRLHLAGELDVLRNGLVLSLDCLGNAEASTEEIAARLRECLEVVEKMSTAVWHVGAEEGDGVGSSSASV